MFAIHLRICLEKESCQKLILSRPQFFKYSLRLIGFIVGKHLFSVSACLTISPPVEANTKTQSLRSILNHFKNTRSDYVDPVAKQKARDYIVSMFKDHRLHTWTEEFPSHQDKINKEYYLFSQDSDTKIEINNKASDTLEHQPTVWPVSYACAQPYHTGSGQALLGLISMASPSNRNRTKSHTWSALYCRGYRTYYA